MSNFDPNTTAGRRGLILKQLEESGQVNVNELSERFKVSEVTIRNDLTQLELKNLLIRARGGAIKTEKVNLDLKISEKKVKNVREKEAIGRKASKFIEEGDTIILDSGTTTIEIVPYLSKIKNLTVITNGLNIATSLSETDNIRVIVPGGTLRNKNFSLIGSMAKENFGNFFCDKLFLGADGIDINIGLSTPDLEEAALNKEMIKMAKKIIVLADSSKFRKRSLAVIGSISLIDILITDKGIQEEEIEAFTKAGIEVVIAD